MYTQLDLLKDGRLTAEEQLYAIKLGKLQSDCHTLRRTFFQKYKELQDELEELQVKLEQKAVQAAG